MWLRVLRTEGKALSCWDQRQLERVTCQVAQRQFSTITPGQLRAFHEWRRADLERPWFNSLRPQEPFWVDLNSLLESEMTERKVVDVASLVPKAVSAMDSDEQVRSVIQGACRHVVVENLEDPSPAEYDLLNWLSVEANWLSVEAELVTVAPDPHQRFRLSREGQWDPVKTFLWKYRSYPKHELTISHRGTVLLRNSVHPLLESRDIHRHAEPDQGGEMTPNVIPQVVDFEGYLDEILNDLVDNISDVASVPDPPVAVIFCSDEVDPGFITRLMRSGFQVRINGASSAQTNKRLDRAMHLLASLANPG